MGTAGIFKFISKIPHIFVGWGRRLNLLKTTEEIRMISKRRLKVCAANEGECSKYVRLIEILNGNVERVHTLMCTKCKCPCLEKSLDKREKCPLHKW